MTNMAARAEFQISAPNLAAARERAEKIAEQLVGDEPYTLDLDARPDVATMDGAFHSWTFEVTVIVIDKPPKMCGMPGAATTEGVAVTDRPRHPGDVPDDDPGAEERRRIIDELVGKGS